MQVNLIEGLIDSKKFFSKKNKLSNTAFLLEKISHEVNEVLGQLKSFKVIPERMVIFKDDIFELVLCNWAPKSKRDWHYHPNTQCWFKCLYGEIQESRTYQVTQLQVGQSGYIDDSQGPHQIENDTVHTAITLHIYKTLGN